ncbi:MAG: hypothetical protein R6X12_03500 [bacterium]
MRFTTAVVVLAGTIATAQTWHQFGPDGISISGLVRIPGIATQLYATTSGVPSYVLYSSDGGHDWIVRDTIRDRIADLAINPDLVQTLYAGGSRGRIWRSLDGGRSWNERGALEGSPELRRLILRPDQPQVLWAATEAPGSADSAVMSFWASPDGGATWHQTPVATGRSVNAVLLNLAPGRPDRVWLGGSIDGTASVHASGDGGTNWRDMTGDLTGTCAWAVAASPTDTAVLLCATDDGIWRTTNSGASWMRMKDAPAWSVEFAPISPHYAYAGSDNLVFRSNNLGINWFADTTTLSGTATRWLRVHDLDGLDVIAANGRGLFRTTNGAYNWTELLTGTSRLTTRFIDFHPTAPESIFACPPGHGLLVSGNRGLDWSPLVGFAGAGFVTGIALNPAALDTLYAVTEADHWLHMTSDRGDSWIRQPIETGFSGRGLLFHPLGPDTLYAWGGVTLPGSPRRFGFWKSTDRGYGWSRIHSPGLSGDCRGFRFAARGESLFTWGTVDGEARVYLSLNRGGSWTSRSSGLGGTSVLDFEPAPGINRTSYICATDAGVYRTLNGGESWTDLGLEQVTAILPDTLDPDLIFAATDTQGLFHTTNAGVLWERDTIELPHRSITFLVRHPDDPAAIYCGTEGAGFYGREVIGVAEPVPGRKHRAVEILPTVARDALVVRLGAAAGGRAVVEFFTPDGRRPVPAAVLDPAPARWTWRRPAELAAGAYLVRVRGAGVEHVARVVLTR